MAKNNESHAAPAENEKLLQAAVAELETMAREAFSDRNYHGVVRVELSIKHGHAVFVRKCPEQTFTAATLN